MSEWGKPEWCPNCRERVATQIINNEVTCFSCGMVIEGNEDET